MKMLKVAMWITLSTLAACAVTETTPAEDQVSASAATEDTSVQDSALTVEPEAAAASCSASGGSCATAFICHHSEGANIGVLGCTGGKICCRF